MEPFTLRHEKALVEKRLKVSIAPRLRERLWQHIEARDEEWQCGWNDSTTRLLETETRLKRALGRQALVAKTQDGAKQGIRAYFLDGYPSNVLEVIEQFWEELPEDQRVPFATAVNDSMMAFKCPWLLFDGLFFRIDDGFLRELIDSAQSALTMSGFNGALDEIRDARESITAGRTKDAIVSALKSVESTLKTILGAQSGTAKELFVRFRESGYLNDIPQNHAKAISTAVLPCIAVLRNELGGHGQGSDVVNVPRSYASLAVYLASAIALFLIEQRTTLVASSTSPTDAARVPKADVPF